MGSCVASCSAKSEDPIQSGQSQRSHSIRSASSSISHLPSLGSLAKFEIYDGEEIACSEETRASPTRDSPFVFKMLSSKIRDDILSEFNALAAPQQPSAAAAATVTSNNNNSQQESSQLPLLRSGSVTQPNPKKNLSKLSRGQSMAIPILVFRGTDAAAASNESRCASESTIPLHNVFQQSSASTLQQQSQSQSQNQQQQQQSSSSSQLIVMKQLSLNNNKGIHSHLRRHSCSNNSTVGTVTGSSSPPSGAMVGSSSNSGVFLSQTSILSSSASPLVFVSPAVESSEEDISGRSVASGSLTRMRAAAQRRRASCKQSTLCVLDASKYYGHSLHQIVLQQQQQQNINAPVVNKGIEEILQALASKESPNEQDLTDFQRQCDDFLALKSTQLGCSSNEYHSTVQDLAASLFKMQQCDLGKLYLDRLVSLKKIDSQQSILKNLQEFQRKRV